MAPSRCRRPAAQVSNRDVPESCGIDPKCRRRSDAQVDQDSGAGDEVIMSIAGHVSRAMLSRYSHFRMEAKRPTRSASRKVSGGSRVRRPLNP
jgi:hypothetical protein